MTGYAIANWDRFYETSETKKLKHLRWVPTPNKHDGLGFRRMAAQENCCELYAAWNVMIQVASKGVGKERGTLIRDGIPLSPDDLRMISGFPSRIFEDAITFFASKSIGWLEMRQISGESPVIAGTSPAEGKEGKEGTEQKRMESDRTPPPLGKYTKIIEAIKMHDSFRNVPDIAIITKLRGVDQSRWYEAVDSMLADYAGVGISVPCRTLGNYLAGKRNRSGQPVRDVEYPSADDALRRAGV